MKKKKKKGFTKFEKRLYKSFLGVSILLIIGILFGQITLAKINLEVQKLEKEVELETDSNQSLVMKINEMASLDNIKEVSEKQGLAYNNENIKTIKDR